MYVSWLLMTIWRTCVHLYENERVPAHPSCSLSVGLWNLMGLPY